MFVKVLLLAFSVAVVSVKNFEELVDVDINGPEVQDALQFAVTQHNKMRDKRYTSQVVKVIKAQKQGVIGEEYIFTVLMARSACNNSKPGSPCAINSNAAIAQPHECTLTVRSVPWLYSRLRMLTKNTC